MAALHSEDPQDDPKKGGCGSDSEDQAPDPTEPVRPGRGGASDPSSSAGGMAASLEGAIAQVNAELAWERAELEEEKRALKRARTELDGEIEAMTKIGVSDEDILELNVAGEIITVKRGTLLVAPPQSVLHAMFSGRWDDSLSKDSAGRPYLEFSPLSFKKLVAHLRTLKLSPPESALEPPKADSDHEQEFHAIVRYLGLLDWWQDHPKLEFSPQSGLSISMEGRKVERPNSVRGSAAPSVPSSLRVGFWQIWKVKVNGSGPAPGSWSSQDGDLVRPFVGIQCHDTLKSSGWSTVEAGSDPPFPGWLPGDEAILKIDTTRLRGQLRLYHLRLNRSFSKDLPDTNEKPWHIHFTSIMPGYSVEISRPTPAEGVYVA